MLIFMYYAVVVVNLPRVVGLRISPCTRMEEAVPLSQ